MEKHARVEPLLLSGNAVPQFVVKCIAEPLLAQPEMSCSSALSIQQAALTRSYCPLIWRAF